MFDEKKILEEAVATLRMWNGEGDRDIKRPEGFKKPQVKKEGIPERIPSKRQGNPYSKKSKKTQAKKLDKDEENPKVAYRGKDQPVKAKDAWKSDEASDPEQTAKVASRRRTGQMGVRG